jgi:3-phosphoinositide dependent protein kinase-1
MATDLTTSYSSDSILNDVSQGGGMEGQADSLGGDAAMPMGGPSAGERHNLRHTLRRNTDEGDGRSIADKGRRRFSKRHSKSGLAAVF